MHAYGGSAEVVQPLTRLGAFFSFGGSVLGQNRLRARAALQAVPLDRLLLETDAPALLPPAEYREFVITAENGATYHEPANLPRLAAGIAGLLGMPAAELADLSTANAQRWLGSGIVPQCHSDGEMGERGVGGDGETGPLPTK